MGKTKKLITKITPKEYSWKNPSEVLNYINGALAEYSDEEYNDQLIYYIRNLLEINTKEGL